MATLKLRNCTIWELKYWRLGGGNDSYVTAGEEGRYEWDTTYTLTTERRKENPAGRTRLDTVNQGGIYYVVWEGEALRIIDEKTASNFPVSEENKYLSNWCIKHHDWMGALDDSLTLDQLSLPGTHDSATEGVSSLVKGFARTQNFDISTQLNDGIRFLDIRADHLLPIELLSPMPPMSEDYRKRLKNDPLQIKHGPVDCGISFGDVLDSCKAFLEQNPTEAIFMLMNSANDDPELMVEVGFNTYLESEKFRDLFYLDSTLRPLNELRGKVVLLRRFASKKRDNFGIDLQDVWKDNATFQNATFDGVRLKVEDQYKETNTHTKEKIVRECLTDAAENKDDGVVHITYNSIAYNKANARTPYQYAWGGHGVKPPMNKSLEQYLSKIEGSQRLGVVMLDFYNDKGSSHSIVDAIIRSNF
ncbi:1-phosphatidylinositol phosphodiesterase [Bacterioplanes sanyensis]|uniref:hypothetical protein n=1 Tax=Bacterioplanes sanyensis TaxID=1249553 RepID=UPI00167B64C6|nr:hypothetical protein [Bacterioplanes sanyensis]GGY58430.1 1-phosphatidylinositol phosphodiesterase [Bacterioplanes sanyensis]